MGLSPPSALLVTVGEAEPLVGGHRVRFDPVADRGVPAHVTALYPFVPRDDLDESWLGRVAAVVGEHAAFDYRFSSTAWFDRDVLYLAPDDPAPFAALTRALEREFPDYPPYQGRYADLAPHLTVAHSADGVDDADLHAVEAELRSGLPIAGRAEHLTLLTEDDVGLWSVRCRFAFAG